MNFKLALERGSLIKLRRTRRQGGGLSGEVHILDYNRKKYIIRICKDVATARFYEKSTLALQKFKVMPKFYGRYRNYVFYEFINGKTLSKTRPTLDQARQIGRVDAAIHTLRYNGKDPRIFEKRLKELMTGKYKSWGKVEERRSRDKIIIAPKIIISKKFGRRIIQLNNYLKNKLNPIITYDSNDLQETNYILRGKKVYFVDIEAVKPRLRGFGIAKGFSKWFRKPSQQQAFLKGYSEILPKDYLTEDYLDLCYLQFSVQGINYCVQIGRDYGKNLRKIKELLKKYHY